MIGCLLLLLSSYVNISGNGWKVFPGDHLESASPSDPSFWSIHPTLERLLHVKYMSGGFENTTWHTDPETQNICHHASCYEESLNGTGFWVDCCYGHYQHDQMMNALTGSKYDHWGQSYVPLLFSVFIISHDSNLRPCPSIYKLEMMMS
jgi:hypothetical protein